MKYQFQHTITNLSVYRELIIRTVFPYKYLFFEHLLSLNLTIEFSYITKKYCIELTLADAKTKSAIKYDYLEEQTTDAKLISTIFKKLHSKKPSSILEITVTNDMLWKDLQKQFENHYVLYEGV